MTTTFKCAQPRLSMSRELKNLESLRPILKASLRLSSNSTWRSSKRIEKESFCIIKDHTSSMWMTMSILGKWMSLWSGCFTLSDTRISLQPWFTRRELLLLWKRQSMILREVNSCSWTLELEKAPLKECSSNCSMTLLQRHARTSKSYVLGITLTKMEKS